MVPLPSVSLKSGIRAATSSRRVIAGSGCCRLIQYQRPQTCMCGPRFALHSLPAAAEGLRCIPGYCSQCHYPATGMVSPGAATGRGGSGRKSGVWRRGGAYKRRHRDERGHLRRIIWVLAYMATAECWILPPLLRGFCSSLVAFFSPVTGGFFYLG